MAAQPCVAPLLEGIIEKLARLFCSVGGDVGGGGAPPWRRHLGVPNDGFCGCVWSRGQRLVVVVVWPAWDLTEGPVVVVVVRLAWSRRWLFGGVLWGLAAVPWRRRAAICFPLVKVSRYACSRFSLGGRCVAASVLLLVMSWFIFALWWRKMPPQIANRSDFPWRGSQSRFVFLHSLVVDAPELCRGARYAHNAVR